MLELVNLLLGGFLLVAGRKLFWLFIGVLGFITGIQLASRIWPESGQAVIIAGLVTGIIFALLAIFLQRLAVGLAGFAAGGFVATFFTGALGIESGIAYWGSYIIGGLIGVALVMLLFDWALITLSSLAGAALITQSVFPESGAARWILLLLAIIGVVIQGYSLIRPRRPKPRGRKG